MRVLGTFVAAGLVLWAIAAAVPALPAEAPQESLLPPGVAWAADEDAVRIALDGLAAGERGAAACEIADVGDAWYARGELDLALAFGRVALDLARTTGHRSAEAAAEVGIAYVEWDRGERDEAYRRLERALAAYHAGGEKVGASAVERRLGNLLQGRGRLDDAEAAYGRSLELARAAGSAAREGAALRSLGSLLAERDRLEEAIDLLDGALAIEETAGDREGIANTLAALGMTAQRLGWFERAERDLRRCLELREQEGSPFGLAVALGNLGSLLSARGDYDRALALHLRNLEIVRRLGARASLASALNNVGFVRMKLGRPEAAIADLEEALAIREELKLRPAAATTLGNLAAAPAALGDVPAALAAARRALDIRQSLGAAAPLARSETTLGLVLLLAGRRDEALPHLERGLDLGSRAGERQRLAAGLVHLAEWWLAAGEADVAAALLAEAVGVAEETGQREPLWRAWLVAGRSALARGDLACGREALEHAADAVEALRAHGAGAEEDLERFFSDKSAPHRELAALAARNADPWQALYRSEQARGRVLADALSGRRMAGPIASDRREHERERELLSRLDAANAALARAVARGERALAAARTARDRARLDLERFRTRLFALSPELADRFGTARPLDGADLDALANDRATLLVEFMAGEDAAWALAVARGPSGVELAVRPLGAGADAIGALAAELRRRLADRDLAALEPARTLDRILLDPLRDLLRGRSHLVVVPDGALWDVPFAALVGPDRRFEIERVAVSYAPSLAALLRMRESRSIVRRRPGELLAVGGALGGDERSRAETGRLAAELARIHGPDRSLVLSGPEATPERLRTAAGGFRIVHVAAHAVLEDRRPLYSRLELAPGDGSRDGFLEAFELMDLDLGAELLVLSACDTGRGRIGGEGIVGFAWAAHLARVGAVVASQWPVDAEATSALMLAFHRRLAAAGSGGRVSSARALQEAARELIGHPRLRHPFYWAGFRLVGVGD